MHFTGELILPDGRIIGAREWRRMYKQRYCPAPESEALEAAREEARQRWAPAPAASKADEDGDRQLVPASSRAGGRGAIIAAVKGRMPAPKLTNYQKAVRIREPG